MNIMPLEFTLTERVLKSLSKEFCTMARVVFGAPSVEFALCHHSDTYFEVPLLILKNHFASLTRPHAVLRHEISNRNTAVALICGKGGGCYEVYSGKNQGRFGCSGVKKTFLLFKPGTRRDLATIQTRSSHLPVHTEYYLILSWNFRISVMTFCYNSSNFVIIKLTIKYFSQTIAIW